MKLLSSPVSCLSQSIRFKPVFSKEDKEVAGYLEIINLKDLINRELDNSPFYGKTTLKREWENLLDKVKKSINDELRNCNTYGEADLQKELKYLLNKLTEFKEIQTEVGYLLLRTISFSNRLDAARLIKSQAIAGHKASFKVLLAIEKHLVANVNYSKN